MSSRLKAITTKAKTLYKSGKYKKWTDAIKAASKLVTGSRPTKKAAVKKATKKVTKKATPKSYHKDTKSHNVKINVTSGISGILDHYKTQYGKLSAKKLLEKTKRGKKAIQKSMTEVAHKIKKIKSL